MRTSESSIEGADYALEALLQREQVKTLYLQWKTLIVGCGCIVLITAVALWDYADKTLIALWVLANAIYLCFRAHSLISELSKTPGHGSDSEQQFGHKAVARYRWYSFTNGILWGLVPLLMFTQNFAVFSVATLTHGGYLAGSVTATAGYDLKAFYAFAYPTTVLWVIGTALNGGGAYLLHIVLFTIAPLIMTVFAMRINAAFKEQMQLRFENANLNHNLREQRDRAENAMHEKNRFLAAASHDLRQPVHTLGLFAASLEPYLVEEKPKMILRQISQTTENMGSLFHSLLDLSKLDANVVQNNPSHMYVAPLMDMLVLEYQEQAEQKQLAIECKCASGVVSYVDPSLLERILRNLLSNAVNHTSIGGVILTATEVDQKHIIVSCIDTGKGIPAEEQQKIFSEYHQLENSERDRKKGLGLGLAIVKRLCDLMDVELQLESRPAHGSTFSLTLQRGDAGSIYSEIRINTNSAKLPYRAIVIDDEEDILVGMSVLLDTWGCSVTSATSGADAMAKLASCPELDIVIADFRLREHESGLAVIQQIRAYYGKNVPAILITGDIAPERLKEAALADVEVLHKPVEPDTLREMLAVVTN